jgi:hypothetical protein
LKLNEILIVHFYTGTFLSVCIATLRSVVQSVVQSSAAVAVDIIKV